MKLEYTKRFLKDYAKLPIETRTRVRHAVTIFREDPFNPLLRNHKLAGRMRGLRAFSAGFDMRIVYRERENRAVVLLLRVGRHRDVYS